MTNPFQPGHHPDADALSAFAENALPHGERQETLAHLATCPDCRQIVALALPEAQPAPQPISAWERLTRRLTVPSWRPAGASIALAGLAVGTVALLRPRPHRVPVQTATLSAVNQPPAAPGSAAPSKTESPVAVAAARPVPRPVPRTVQVGPGSAATADTRKETEAGVEAARLDASRAPQMRLQQEANAPLGLVPAPAGQPPRPLNSGRSAAGLLAPMRAAPAPPPAVAAPVILAEGAAASANEAPLPAPAARPLASSVGLGNAVSASRATQPLAVRITGAPLPGDHAILASAARGPLIVAVNDQHIAFLSNDAGAHWQPILIAWAGHTVSVRLQTLASISGIIMDATGAAIAGATVTLNTPSRATTTDATGHFVFADLPPGSVALQASAPGFATLSQTLNLAAGVPLEDDLHLTVGQVSTTVEVATAKDQIEMAADQMAAAPAPARKVKAAPPLPRPLAPRTAPLTSPPSAQFEIVTDDGRRFTSSDGRAWTRVAPKP